MTRVFLSALLLPALAAAHEYGPDARYTTAPGDDPKGCSTATCHTSLPNGGPLNAYGGGVIATFSGGSSYTPGGPPITIVVTVVDPKNTHFGFQMTARLESDLVNGQAGDFTVGDPNTQLVICDNGSPKISGKKCPAGSPVEFIEHAYPTNSQVSTTPYTFTWTPPATNVGPVHFYVAGNSVNGDLVADGNDHVYTASYVLTPVLCSTGTPAITGVVSAGAFGALPDFAAGSWLEIYGSNFASNVWNWAAADFNGANAPASLAGISVSINGKPAFIDIVSGGQVNVQAPADAANGSLDLVVSSCGNAGAAFKVQKKPLAPGLLAPPGFIVNGKQYLVALFQDGAYVGNTNLIPGLTFRPAKPGDVLVLYGIGFGDAKTSDGTVIPPGTVVSSLNSLVNPVKIDFGSTPADVVYAGLAPSFVGLYQFTLTVPSVADGDIPINITQNGTPLAQPTFYLTVHR